MLTYRYPDSEMELIDWRDCYTASLLYQWNRKHPELSEFGKIVRDLMLAGF